MCSTSSIIMPADYEMLVSHSPPIFSSYLSDYPTLRLSRDTFSRVPRVSCRSISTSSLPLRNPFKMPATPRRPCLVIRPEDTLSSSDEDPTSPTRLKKKVVFADDRGMSLTHVRIMTEPSNVPPLLSSRFLSEVTQGLTAEPVAREEPWEITFAQPASDYVEFRRKLDAENVSLENVIIKKSEECVVGTVKVRNLYFEKEVFVRLSSDEWKTHEDAFCTYISNSTGSVGATYILYDTFSFKLPLHPKANLVEFCVCFRCNGEEFWDNNDGKNYILLKKTIHTAIHKSHSSDELLDGKNYNKIAMPNNGLKCADAMRAKVESWSEFASWTHLENSSPYW